MTFLYKQVTEKKDWLKKGALLFEITEGEHKGKLIEVIASQVTKDIDNDNIIDVLVVQVEARRVNATGETVLSGSAPIRADLGKLTIMQAAIANGDINPTVYIAEKVQEVITKTLNLETSIGAFSFLPTMST